MKDYHKNIEGNKGAPASWCPLPWSHISIKGNGFYRLCCHSNVSKNRGILKDETGRLFHISQANWSDVINSDTLKSVRKNMLKGKWSRECIRCKREYKNNMNPRNIYERSVLAGIIESENYPSYLKAKAMTKEDGSLPIKDFPMSFIDIRLGNQCNLKCIMCSPTDSNKWYDDYNQIWGDKFFTDSGKKIQLVFDKKGKLKPRENIYIWNENAHLWSQMEKNINKLRRIYIVGGEPLLIAKHYDFLEQCINKEAAKKLVLDYNSNITIIPSKAWKIWKRFKKVIIGISIDGIGSINNFIRYPSTWNKIERNLFLLDNAKGNFVLHITATISLLNIWHLPEMIEYFIRSNYKKINSRGGCSLLMSPHPAHRPPYLNINILEGEFKEKIEKRFNFYKNKLSNFDWQSYCGSSKNFSWEEKVIRANKILDNYIKYMWSVKYSKEELVKWRSNFIHSMDKLDELRKTKWPVILPELYKHTLKWRKLPKRLF